MRLDLLAQELSPLERSLAGRRLSDVLELLGRDSTSTRPPPPPEGS